MEKKINIIDWFDTANYQHLRSYDHLEKTGFWSQDCQPPLSVEIPLGWQIALVAKLAKSYLDLKLGR